MDKFCTQWHWVWKKKSVLPHGEEQGGHTLIYWNSSPKVISCWPLCLLSTRKLSHRVNFFPAICRWTWYIHQHTQTDRQKQMTDEVLFALKMLSPKQEFRMLTDRTEGFHFSSLCCRTAENNQQSSEGCSRDLNMLTWGQEAASSYMKKWTYCLSKVSIHKTYLSADMTAKCW